MEGTLLGGRSAVIGRPAHEADGSRPMVLGPPTDGVVRSAYLQWVIDVLVKTSMKPV